MASQEFPNIASAEAVNWEFVNAFKIVRNCTQTSLGVNCAQIEAHRTTLGPTAEALALVAGRSRALKSRA